MRAEGIDPNLYTEGRIGLDLGRVLSDSQIETINEAAADILERTGFKVLDDDALKRCAAAGALIDEPGGLVRLPRELLCELVARAPSSYTISSIGDASWEVGGGSQCGLAIVTDPWIIDYETGEPRRPRLDDVRRNTILAQRMEHVAGMSCMDFPAEDAPGPASNLRAWETHLLHTAKHYHYIPAAAESNRRWRDIVEILADGRDAAAMRLFSVHAAVISPLTISTDNVDLIRLACEYDAPVVPTICPMAGSSGPYTHAGTLLLGHTENLFLCALTQILKAGLPYLYAFGPSVTDLRTSRDLYYTLDKVLWKTASVQLARANGLPAMAEAGGTMTYAYESQSGMEGSLFMAAAVASGADVLSGFGSCYCAMGMSAEMMVIQKAWLDAARFLQRGMDTKTDKLGIESICQAGPGGHFLTDPLTLQQMRAGEFFEHDLFDYTPAEYAGKSMLQRAHDKVTQQVADFRSPVPARVQERLKRYFHDECHDVEQGKAR